MTISDAAAVAWAPEQTRPLLPFCMSGSVLRIVLTEKKPANQPIPLDYEVLHALWPGFFEAGKRRNERPMRVHLPTGDGNPAHPRT
jgi:hypothetical protein